MDLPRDRIPLVTVNALSRQLDTILSDSLAAYNHATRQTLHRALALIPKPFPHPARHVFPPLRINHFPRHYPHPTHLPTFNQLYTDPHSGWWSQPGSFPPPSTPHHSTLSAGQPHRPLRSPTAAFSEPGTPPFPPPTSSPRQTAGAGQLSPNCPTSLSLSPDCLPLICSRDTLDAEQPVRYASDQEPVEPNRCPHSRRSRTPDSRHARRAHSPPLSPAALPITNPPSDRSAPNFHSRPLCRRRLSPSPPAFSSSPSRRAPTSCRGRPVPTSPRRRRPSSLSDRYSSRIPARQTRQSLLDELQDVLIRLGGHRPVSGTMLISKLRMDEARRGKPSGVQLAKLAWSDIPGLIDLLNDAHRAGLVSVRNTQSPWGSMTVMLLDRRP